MGSRARITIVLRARGVFGSPGSAPVGTPALSAGKAAGRSAEGPRCACQVAVASPRFSPTRKASIVLPMTTVSLGPKAPVKIGTFGPRSGFGSDQHGRQLRTWKRAQY